ncbi:MAG: hypothetical protein V2J10_06860 [Wenzhouxiangella sp.]|jgi:hypothetical protein|nr:hypothetical protein [Wenzhouxiangella sp.]
MNQGTILAIIVVVAYLAFEVFAISKVSYRTEPLYIFGRFVAVDRAMALCGAPDSQMRSRFSRNRASVRQRAERELVEGNPGESREVIDRLLAERIQQHESEVDALVEALGCDDIEIFKLKRGYENRARLNLPTPVDGEDR